MLTYYQKKYPHSDIGHVILSMTYFVDAEKQDEDPIDMKGLTWIDVKTKMQNTISDYVKDKL